MADYFKDVTNQLSSLFNKGGKDIDEQGFPRKPSPEMSKSPSVGTQEDREAISKAFGASPPKNQPKKYPSLTKPAPF